MIVRRNSLVAFVLTVLMTAGVPLARSQDAPPAPNANQADGDSAEGRGVVVDARTERVIRSSLAWLARKQDPSGSFAKGQHSVAFTSYALIAFLAAGELPGEGEYGQTVERGMNYLLASCRDNGLIAAAGDEVKMYGHGIATIALAELYGQTKDPSLRPKLEKAIKLIVDTQSIQPGHIGGWRYPPARADADISVTVLQAVALRAAKNSGLDVPQETIDKAVEYVRSCSVKGTGGFAYQSNGGQGPGFARTAAAIYSLQVCGQYDDPLVAEGSKFLFDKYRSDRDWFTYGAFYAAPAQYMIGGETWRRWYEMIRAELLQEVRREGGMSFWEPIGGNGQNALYATSVYTMILAMPYQYVPLYQR